MKILIAVHGFPPTHFAGAERTGERIAHWLLEQGHDIEVFTCEKLDDPNTRIETSTENGLVIHRFYYDIKQGDYFQNLYDDPRIGEAFRQVLAQNTFDIVHIVSGYLLGVQVIDAAKSLELPVVLTLTEFWFMCFRLNLLTANNEMCVGPDSDEKCMRCVMEDQRRYRLPAQKAPAIANAFWSIARHTSYAQTQIEAAARRRLILKDALESVDQVICPSQFLITKFQEYGYNTSRFTYIRHGAKPSAAPLDVQPQPLQAAALRLGFIGQIKAHKGVDLLLDAVIPLIEAGHPITLNLWGSKSGDDAYSTAQENRTAKFPAIRWMGSYATEQLPEVLSGFDILVVPSRWYENSPAVILEAYTAGIPVIATDLGGMKEMVHEGRNGLRFALNDASDLQAKIKQLLEHPQLLADLRAGIPPVPTLDSELEAILAVYQQVTQL